MRQKKVPLTGRAALLATMSEAAFRRQVITWAKRAGWMVSSMHDSRQQTWGTDRGIPDLIMAREGRLIFAELKKAGGRISPHQDRWIDQLNYAEQEVYVWYPSDEDDIKRALDYSAETQLKANLANALAAGRSDAAEDAEVGK